MRLITACWLRSGTKCISHLEVSTRPVVRFHALVSANLHNRRDNGRTSDRKRCAEHPDEGCMKEKHLSSRRSNQFC
jgi:hypothetical protein